MYSSCLVHVSGFLCCFDALLASFPALSSPSESDFHWFLCWLNDVGGFICCKSCLNPSGLLWHTDLRDTVSHQQQLILFCCLQINTEMQHQRHSVAGPGPGDEEAGLNHTKPLKGSKIFRNQGFLDNFIAGSWRLWDLNLSCVDQVSPSSWSWWLCKGLILAAPQSLVSWNPPKVLTPGSNHCFCLCCL